MSKFVCKHNNIKVLQYKALKTMIVKRYKQNKKYDEKNIVINIKKLLPKNVPSYNSSRGSVYAQKPSQQKTFWFCDTSL